MNSLPERLLSNLSSLAVEGQELAILSGCSAPVLLHENDDGTYRFIGSCFVQGWMEGEILNFYGSTAEEAWKISRLKGDCRSYRSFPLVGIDIYDSKALSHLPFAPAPQPYPQVTEKVPPG